MTENINNITLNHERSYFYAFSSVHLSIQMPPVVRQCNHTSHMQQFM